MKVKIDYKNKNLKLDNAAGLGFEPRFRGPEPRVLPLDDPAILLEKFFAYKKF